ncbi:MAG: histidine kinase dimerization/phospho-acceptor domain-containing protein, partial [Bacteroidota bacterium]
MRELLDSLDAAASPELVQALQKEVESLAMEVEGGQEGPCPYALFSPFFRNVFKVFPDPVALVDEHGVIHRVNEAWTERLGYDAAAIEGKPIGEAVHPHLREPFADHFSRLNERTPSFSTILTTEGGQQVPVEAHTLFLSPNQGETCVLLVFEDQTEVEQLRLDLADAHHRMREATDAKQEFLANISHEMRTPMSSILGFSRLILNAGASDEVREYAGAIYDSAESLLVVMNDLLDFSTIEAGELSLEAQHFSLADMLRSLQRLYVIKVEHKGLELVFDTDPELPVAVIGDRTRLSQVLINLLSNAVKFTHRGRIEVKSEVKAVTDNICSLQFIISDTGIGISDHDLEHIFLGFNQSRNSATREYRGTGL